MKPLLLILSHNNSESQKIQKDELTQNNIDKFIIYYVIPDTQIYRKVKIDKENNIIYIKSPNNFESNSILIYNAIKHIHNTLKDEISGIFKTNDDANLDLNKLYQCIEDNEIDKYFGVAYHTKEHISTFHQGKCESEELNRKEITIPECKYCSGGGYYISKDIIPYIIENELIFKEIPYEDVCVGLSLNKNGIYPTPIDVKNKGCLWEEFKENEPIRNEPTQPPQPFTIQGKSIFQGAELCRYCGYPKNKIRYNFCQKCGRLY
jgi:hypothetical protein